jgi:hypothetical protein
MPAGAKRRTTLILTSRKSSIRISARPGSPYALLPLGESVTFQPLNERVGSPALSGQPSGKSCHRRLVIDAERKMSEILLTARRYAERSFRKPRARSVPARRGGLTGNHHSGSLLWKNGSSMTCKATLLGLFLAAFSFSQVPNASDLKQRAEKGDAAAQNALGAMYNLGQGVPQDYAQAVRWFSEAADQGDASAQFNLGALRPRRASGLRWGVYVV